MNTANPNIQALIDYLDDHLTGQAYTRWQQTGPRTFFYKDDVDTIFVHVGDTNLTIITDGKEVVDRVEMIPLYGVENDADVHNSYLQNILEKF